MAPPTPQPTTPPPGGTDPAQKRAIIDADKYLRSQLIAALQVVEDRLESMGETLKRRCTPPKERAA